MKEGKLPFPVCSYYDPAKDDDESGLELMPGQEGREEFAEDMLDMFTGTHTYDELFYKKSGRRLSGEGNLAPKHLAVSQMANVGPMNAKATEKMDLEKFRKFITSEIRKTIFEEIDEASTTSSIQGYQSPLGTSRDDLKKKDKKKERIGEKEFALEIMREFNELGLTEKERIKLIEAGLIGRIASRAGGGAGNILGTIGKSMSSIKGSKDGLANVFKDMMQDVEGTGASENVYMQGIKRNLNEMSGILEELDDSLLETQPSFDRVVSFISLLKEIDVPIYDEIKGVLVSQLSKIPSKIGSKIELIEQLVEQVSEKFGKEKDEEEEKIEGVKKEQSAGSLLKNIFVAKDNAKVKSLVDTFNDTFVVRIADQNKEIVGELKVKGGLENREIKIGDSPWIPQNRVKELIKNGTIEVHKK